MAIEPTDHNLVVAAVAGDREAFDALARRYRPGLLAVALDLSGSFDVAGDLAQEALCRAWEHVGELRDAEAFGPWLRRIATNCYRMWIRRPWREDAELAAAPEPVQQPEQLDEVMRRELQRALARGLRSLPPQSRLALLMRVLGGAGYAEIARFLGVPESTVAGRIYRARRHLEARLSRLLDD